MYKVWTDAAGDADALARALEAHLNEFAQDVVAVSYQVGDEHRVLAVYRAIEPATTSSAEVAVAQAESLLEEA